MSKTESRGINFGKKGETARTLIDQYAIKGNVSELMRKLVIGFLSDNPHFKNVKVVIAKQELKAVCETIGRLGKKKGEKMQELRVLGVTDKEIERVLFS